MSMLSDLLSKAKQLEVELAKEGTVLVGDAESLAKELVQNLEHEVQKEVGGTPANTPEGEPTANAEQPAAPADAPDTSGVQTSADVPTV